MPQLVCILQFVIIILFFLLSFLNNNYLFELKNLPVLFYILYFICLFFIKIKDNFFISLILLIDIIFVTWTIFIFNNDYFIFFYFFIILYIRFNNSFKNSFFIFLFTFISFYSISIIKILQNSNFYDFKLLTFQFIIKPVIFLVAFYIINKLFKKVEYKDFEISELKNQINIKNNILTALSHELRTPLTMIKSSVDIILDGNPGKINIKQKNFLDIISNNVFRLINLVEDILLLIKIENSWLKLDLKAIDIIALIKEIVNNMKPIISQKKQILKYSHPKIISKAIADKKWLQQVMINLINNASKHLAEDGIIIVTLKENERVFKANYGKKKG